MSHFPLTYTRDAAACLTFLGRTAEAVVPGAETVWEFLPPRPSENYDFKGILPKSGLGQRPYRGFWRGGDFSFDF